MSALQPFPDTANPGEPKSRQRVSVACLPCRKKRIRCDGAVPTCSTCVERQMPCEYNFTENKRKPPSKIYVNALEARIRCLEDQLRIQNASQFGPNPLGADGEDAGLMHFGDAQIHDDREMLSSVTGLLGRLNIGDDGQLHYFGSQSNFHLLNSNLGYATMESSVCMQQQGLAAAECLGRNVPLSKELQEHLLELYWTWQNPWNYIVHKGAFTEAFQSRTYGKYCTPLLLSAIFALTSRYSDRQELRAIPDDPSSAGSAFFEQAKVLLMYESQAPTVATVQAVALMAIRALSDNQEALGWLYCGNAARMAFNLGLNVDCDQWVATGLLTETEAEVRKVTWWGCHNLDKVFSIALGRPGCTRKSQYTCQKPSLDLDAEFEPWVPTCLSGDWPVGMQSRTVSTAHSTAESLSIASEAMDQIYAPNSGLTKNNIQDIIAKADVELRAYYVNLPSHIRLPSSARASVPAHVYHLHMQYHVNLILLHRPLVQKAMGTSDAGLLLNLEANPHMKTCRDSAVEVAKLLQIYKQKYSWRFTTIVTVHIAFTAAIIHLVDIKPENSAHRQQAIRGLQSCIDALESMKLTWGGWSMKALHAIHVLAEEWSICDIFETLLAGE